MKNTGLRAIWRKGFAPVLTVIALLIQSCGGGGGGGTSTSSATITVSPANGGFVEPGGEIVFTINNSNFAKSPATYSIYIFNDGDGAWTLASMENLAEDGAGLATWATGVTAESNRTYWWRYFATTSGSKGEQTQDSGIMALHVKKTGGMSPIAPRNGGYLDLNSASAPRLAVKNFFSYGGVDVTYDFEVFEDGGLTLMLGSAYGVAQSTTDYYTSADVPVLTVPTGAAAEALVADYQYFWRARAVINGVAQDWTQTFSFQVKDMCQLRASRYAEVVIDWTHDYNCQELLRTDTSQALGSANAGGFADQDHPGYGYFSMDIGGEAIFEMGTAVYDMESYDIRIYQFVSTEPIEVFAAQSEAGPWYSMGWTYCGYYLPGENPDNGHCDFDLGSTPLRYARYIKIKDLEDMSCYQTAGAEIDAVVALHSVASTSSASCTR
ncbi:MAG: hypothetical protein HZB29_13540 [Nitrospinae bacterium]|nr:hypothetical protein [Nitrospinota bacterium]